MTRLQVTHRIPAALDDVWTELADIRAHVEWMADAGTLEFLGPQEQGVGTRISVETRVGPLRTVDLMEFTVWDPPRRMAVRHEGIVTGEGAFELRAVDDETTELVWVEELDFPIRLGGRLGELVARPVLAAMWRNNLRRFAARF